MKNAPRPYQNQRLRKAKPRHQQVLEVSIRREKHREKKVQSVLRTFALVFLFSVLSAGVWVGTREGLRRFVWQNSAFYLTDLRVKTDGTLTREQIVQCGGIVEGSNLLGFSENRVRAALLRLPQVEVVDVQRSLPHRVDIEVQERQPIAWLTEDAEVDPTATDRSFLIDRRGFVMKPRKTLPEYYPLPIISGVELGNLVPGQKANVIQITSALELLHANDGNAHWQIKSIDVKKRYCLVVTDRSHAEITFGLDDIDKQLAKLNRLLEYLEPQHREIQTVNLLVKWNIPVTFADEAPETVPPVVTLPGKSGTAKKPEPAPRTPPATPSPVSSTRKPSETFRKPFHFHE